MPRQCAALDRHLPLTEFASPRLASPPTVLSVGAALLKPGGTLVYSTCTINPSENEGNVAWALQTIGELELAPQPPHFRMGNEGLAVMGLSAQHAQLVQRFDPCAPLDTNGFFIAKFIKRAATERR